MISSWKQENVREKHGISLSSGLAQKHATLSSWEPGSRCWALACLSAAGFSGGNWCCVGWWNLMGPPDGVNSLPGSILPDRDG